MARPPRIILDLLVSISAIAAFVVLSKTGSAPFAIAIGLALLVAAGFAGNREPKAKWVAIHPVVMMAPELIAFPVALATCRSFECGGVIAFLAAISLSTLVLIVVAFAGFGLRRIRR
jgi:hypothetical protein